MITLLQDARYSLRALLKQPSFTIVAVATLALGIGANTAIFGIVNGVLLRPLPYRDADRVVMIWSHWVNWKKTWVSEPELADYRKMATTLEHVSGLDSDAFNLTGGGEPMRVRTAQVQADTFAALGVQPIFGRVFTPEEDRPGAPRVVLLNEALWRSRFGSDLSVIGRTVLLDNTPYEVIGILPAALRLPIDYGTRSTTELWMPLRLGPPNPNDRGNHGINAIARLKPGVTLAQAQAEVDAITRSLQQTYAGYYDAEFGVTLVPAPVEVFGDVRQALIVLLLAVGAVLLIACANVANLMLARSEARQKEIAIRAVLGAGRGRIVRQLLTESMVLSTFGAGLGVLLAYGLMRALVALDPLKVPRVQDLGVDARVLAFTAIVAVITGIVFGIAPAVHASRADLQPALKEGGRDSRSSTGVLRRVLVVGEIAASLALVAVAILLTRSFAQLLAVDAGFNVTHVLTFRTSLPSTTYREVPARAKAYVEVGRRLRESPGVEAAGAVTGLPLNSTRGDWGIQIEGDSTDEATQRRAAADWQVITPGYFEALGTRVLEGRTVTDADRADTLPVIVINESMARKVWPGRRALGRRIKMGGPTTPWITVIGIVADVRHRGLHETPRTEMYRPHAQYPYSAPAMTWVLRTRTDPLAAVGQARAAVRAVDPALGISDIATMQQVLNDSTSDRRLDMLLFAMLGGLALALATVGVYGVVAYSVTQRTHEIGVRMAIGAQATDVVRMVLGEGAHLAMAGIVAGTALALIATRLVRGLLFNVSPTDPITFGVVVIALTAIAMLASYVPARRATRVDPMLALRGE